MNPSDAVAIVHHSRDHRYEISVDGVVAGHADYELAGDTMTFTHTVTVPAMRGRGVAALVVRAALDDARSAGRVVIPQCWYVAEFIAQHPEYSELLPDAPASYPTAKDGT